jgi:hypothetical protein
MKKIKFLIVSIAILFFINSCSSIKVLNSWKSDSVSSVDDNNVIVIARTDNNQVRIAFENEITNQLRAIGMTATSSFTKFPKLNPDEEVSEEKRNMIISMLQDEGFNAVVLTVLKDVNESSKTVTDGGYYAGGNYAAFYPSYFGGFNRYYYNHRSYSTYGNYVPRTSTTKTSKIYILETVIYDLTVKDKAQLVAVVTSKIDNPKDVDKTAKEYVKAITKSLNNNKK